MIGPTQKRLLSELSYMRVAPDDAWMTTDRLAHLTGRSTSAVNSSMKRLRERFLVKRRSTGRAGTQWKITQMGRDELRRDDERADRN